ncbi:Protein of unknown function [Tindallia magadiensis]|uniref:Niacin transporter n=1 Tax=Tindallia magadiensis TaxID=69895 RepID=A0A1I3GVD6_9FIRM|nr:ECF transporter S component [Tindallia magadiensis]SFI27330.1 Protein of unknown function [Tindallia magadiensis]
MNNKNTRELVWGAMLIAVGVVLPIAFHAVGGAGPVFLPMHLPVFFAGIILNPYLAGIVGFLTPFISSMLTGMPPLFPMMPIMMMELATYGFVTSHFVYQKNRRLLPSLCISMVAGRVVAGFTVWGLSRFFAVALPGPVLFLSGSILTGIPGILIQLIFIPSVIGIVSLRKKEVGYR